MYEIYQNSTLQLKNAVSFFSKKYFSNSKKYFYEFVQNSSVVLCIVYSSWNTSLIAPKFNLGKYFCRHFVVYKTEADLPQASGSSFLTAVVLISLKNEPLCTQRKCEMYRKKFSLSATTVNPVNCRKPKQIHEQLIITV